MKITPMGGNSGYRGKNAGVSVATLGKQLAVFSTWIKRGHRRKY